MPSLRRTWTITLVALAALVPLVAAGCGGDGDSSGDEPAPAAPEIEGEAANEAPAGDAAEPPRPTRAQLKAAGIDTATGAYQGLAPDARRGTRPSTEAPGPLAGAAERAGCRLQTDLRDEGNDHLGAQQSVPDYATTPPTSGDHDPTPVADGAYRTTPPLENVVHSLEHGRIAIQYSPDLPEPEQLLLKGIFDKDPDGMLLFPNLRMPYEVATTAWGDLITCRRFSMAVGPLVAAFRDRFRGRGPERVPF